MGLRPALLTGERSLSVPMDLCQAKQHRVWATLVSTRGNRCFLWNTAGSTVDAFERFDTDLAAERNLKKLVVIIQICLKEVIENKLLLKATAMVNCGEALWVTHL